MSSILKRYRALAGSITLLVVLSFAYTLVKTQSQQRDSHGHTENDRDEGNKGPHGGRLLEKGELGVELTIFEGGGAPRWRVYLYEEGKAIAPEGTEVKITLQRLTSQEVYHLKPEKTYLTAEPIVEEPHSFDINLELRRKEETYQWSYPSYEGRTQLTGEAITQSGIVTAKAGPAELKIKLPVTGRLVPDEDHLAHVSPRFPGIVKEVKKRLGDQVTQGDLLAVIESNVNLNRYEIRSLISGTVVKKDLTVGEFVSEKDTIYVVADLSSVWIDLNIYRHDFSKIKIGQELNLQHTTASLPLLKTHISYISPFGAEYSQSMLARAVVANTSGELLPGLFVSGDLLLESVSVPVAIKREAVQKFRDWDVVFTKVGNTFEIVILKLGRQDDTFVEVISGLQPEQTYVATNSYLIKADILKSGASHEH